MRLRLTVLGYEVAAIELVDDEPEEYPILGSAEGEHIVFTPDE